MMALLTDGMDKGIMTKGINYSTLLLLSSLSAATQAKPPTEIKLGLTQLTGQHCQSVTTANRKTLPGDCITYRIKVENIGEEAAQNIEVSALIPEHTILHNSFRNIANQEKLSSVIEQKSDGTRIIKTKLDSLSSKQNSTVVLEYSVMVL